MEIILRNNIKKSLKKKGFLIFRKIETSKTLLIFQETELYYISGNGNPKKLFIFQETETLKNFLYLRK